MKCPFCKKIVRRAFNEEDDTTSHFHHGCEVYIRYDVDFNMKSFEEVVVCDFSGPTPIHTTVQCEQC